MQPESAFTVGISLKEVTQSVYAEDITISYDPAIFEFEKVTEVSENINILGHTVPGDGTLRIVAANIGGVSGSSVPIMNVHFKAKSGVSNTSGTIAVTQATLGVMPEGTVIEAGLSSKTIVISPIGPVDKEALRQAIKSCAKQIRQRGCLELKRLLFAVRQGCFPGSDHCGQRRICGC